MGSPLLDLVFPHLVPDPQRPSLRTLVSQWYSSPQEEGAPTSQAPLPGTKSEQQVTVDMMRNVTVPLLLERQPFHWELEERIPVSLGTATGTVSVPCTRKEKRGASFV